MDSYRNRTLTSDLLGSKLSINSLFPPCKTLFEKLIQYTQEKYSQRLTRLEESSEIFKNSCKVDPALQAMKDNSITEKYMDQRIAELFQSSLLQENERTITSLQEEVIKQKAEILKLEQQISSKKQEFEKYEDKLRMSTSRENLYYKENFNEVYEKEKKKNEALETKILELRKDLDKTREICKENEKLQRYCEQLEDERDKIAETFRSTNEFKTMMEAQKQAGFETIKELQNNFKKKSKSFKKKIIDQKAIIEKLENEIVLIKNNQGEPKNIEKDKDFYEKKESELIEKHKQQIFNLQNQYQQLLESKIKEIQHQIDPKTTQNYISQEKYYELCKQKTELEIQFLQMKESIKSMKANDNTFEIENLKNKLQFYEQKNNELESRLNSLNSKLAALQTENKNLNLLLKNNSEAFDTLQEEVKNESLKMKQKNQISIENMIKENKEKAEKEFEYLKSQMDKYQELYQQSTYALQLETQVSKQLREEIDSLRSEKEQIRAKQNILEEKIDNQSKNFKLQLQNKKKEIDFLKQSKNSLIFK